MEGLGGNEKQEVFFKMKPHRPGNMISLSSHQYLQASGKGGREQGGGGSALLVKSRMDPSIPNTKKVKEGEIEAFSTAVGEKARKKRTPRALHLDQGMTDNIPVHHLSGPSFDDKARPTSHIHYPLPSPRQAHQ